MKKVLTIIILLLLALIVPVTIAWFSNTSRTDADMVSYVHKSYFESGDGTAARQYAGSGLSSDEGCAFEIKYPVQLYYFSWLQAMGYFNIPNDGETTIDQVYFYLSDDLDMTGWVLPQVGTQDFPFVGNFDGNGHTISNLTVQNVETWTDTPEVDINGLNIVGFFGVIGSLYESGANAGKVHPAVPDGEYYIPDDDHYYTYESSVNEVKNLVIEDAIIKTDLSSSLVGIAAGYVNGTMENVKVVGGTLRNVSATTALTEYTTNLSDFGAVGYCTDAYKEHNIVTTVIVYDPQVYTTQGSGPGSGQANNWGGSVDMLDMYTNILGVFNATSTESVTYDTEITITHHADGTETTVVNSSGTAALSVTVGGTTYPIRVTEVKENGDVIASYSLVRRPDGNTNFMYLYGEADVTTQTKTIHHIYENEIDTILIYSGSNYLTFSGTAFGNTTTEASATQWVNDSGKLYTLRDTNADGTLDTKYYIKRDASNNLSYTTGVAIDAAAPGDATTWAIDSTDHYIYNGEWYLCYKNSTWQLARRETNLITESTNTHYLTVAGSPIAIADANQASALSWTKTTVSGGYNLSTVYNGTTYYLMCDSSGLLSLATSPASPTVWNNIDAAGGAKAKIYTLVDENNGWALYYDATNGWKTTTYKVSSSGNDWGGSIDFLSMNQRLWSLYGSASGPTSSINVGGSDRRYKYYNSNNTIGSVTFDIPKSGNNTNPLSTQNVFRLTGVRNPSSGVTTPETILPLIVTDEENGDYTASSINTGYIVSGNNDSYGDIRVSSYPIKFLNNSLNSTKYTINQIYASGVQFSIATNPSGSTKTGGVVPIMYNSTTSSKLEILSNKQTSWSNTGTTAFGRISDSYNENNNSTCLTSYSKTIDEDNLEKYTSSRSALDSILKTSGTMTMSAKWGVSQQQTGLVHGLHFMGSTISNNSSSKVTANNVVIKGETYSGYELPKYCIDFNLNTDGVVNLFAGTYYGNGTTNVDSFFSLWKVTRDPSNVKLITNIQQINGIYKNSSGEIAYSYGTGAPSAPSGYSASDLVFDVRFLTSAPPEQNALYYFEFPMEAGEYAIGSVSGSSSGAYLLYLDISASATVEGDSKFETSTTTIVTDTKAGDDFVYTTTNDETETIHPSTNPTFFPLAWDNGDVADTNTGYVVSGANYTDRPPGDIRISKYDKDSQAGTSYSIWRSLNNAGTLNNSAVYTIVNGTQQTITAYGIGNQYTQNYSRVVLEMNDLLDGEDYVYGLHFMPASISISNLVTIPRAKLGIPDGSTGEDYTYYTDYQVPEDCIDFNVQSRGRITLFAGTFFSGSSVNCFFSLNQIIRDNSNNITAIKKITGIYGKGDSSLYIYEFSDGTMAYSDNSSAVNALPSGYTKIYDTTVLSATRSLQQDAVYYFEVPLDPGEFALGSADGNGAYLLYLDIAANAAFDAKTIIKEVTEIDENDLHYPLGVGFVDAADSDLFDDEDSKVDPKQSVFISIPISNSTGDTVFSMDNDKLLTVTNSTSSLSGYVAMSIPDGASLVVNGGTAITASGTHTITEKVTEIDSSPNGETVITVTTTTKTITNGVTTTTVEQTVTTTLGSTTTTVTTTPAPAYDNHELIPTDNTVDPATTASKIIEYTYESSNSTTNEIARSGDLNIVETDHTITISGNTYVVCDVVKMTGGTDTTAGTYVITMTGTAGTYTITVNAINSDFTITINGTTITTTGTQSITIS